MLLFEIVWSNWQYELPLTVLGASTSARRTIMAVSVVMCSMSLLHTLVMVRMLMLVKMRNRWTMHGKVGSHTWMVRWDHAVVAW